MPSLPATVAEPRGSARPVLAGLPHFNTLGRSYQRLKYRASINCIREGSYGYGNRQTTAVYVFTSIQRRPARLIGGAIKGTLSIAIDIQLHLTSIERQFKVSINESIKYAARPTSEFLKALRAYDGFVPKGLLPQKHMTLFHRF